VKLGGATPVIVGDAPIWLAPNGDGDLVADFGFTGQILVENDRVKINKRFLGWPNFVFDTDSPFFGKSIGEVVSLIAAGPDLVQGKPNWQLAFENFWNNGEWQHGDILVKLLETLVMAFLGTLLGALVAFPLGFLAARNITPNRTLNWTLKRLFDFLRSVDMLIWALFFTRAFGPGPLAGSAAVFLTEAGTLGKIYSEGLENIDDKAREGIASTGASEVLVQRYGVIPQVLPVMLSQTLYQWESNTRGATIIGAVGAGGIGLKLWEAMRTNDNWSNVFYMVLLILAVVFIFDSISNALRSRLIGRQG
jgi:phosphonate transport system permease protein